MYTSTARMPEAPEQRFVPSFRECYARVCWEIIDLKLECKHSKRTFKNFIRPTQFKGIATVVKPHLTIALIQIMISPPGKIHLLMTLNH